MNVEGSSQHILTDLLAFIFTAIAAIVILTTRFIRADPGRAGAPPSRTNPGEMLDA
jgi:Co/Zn/Cd efflux system component